MKVLHINSYYVTTSLYRNLLNKLAHKGVINHSYVFAIKGKEYKVDNDVTMRYTHNKFDRMNYFTKHVKTYIDAKKNIDVESYDVLHAHSLFSNGLIAYLLSKKYNIPYIVAVRDTDINVFYKKMFHLRWIGRMVLKHASKVVFISSPYLEYTADHLVYSRYRQLFMDKSIVIPNGIEDFYLEHQGGHEQDSDVIRLLYVGRINKRKNVETSIEVCKQLIKQGYEVCFTIVGTIEDDSYKQYMELDFIDYIEFVDKETLLNIYKKNDIFIMPSRRETFGLVYGEAMSQGLPVIYTKGQGFDGKFEDGKIGFSVTCEDVHHICMRIIEIVQCYEVMSKQCVVCSNEFDWNMISNNYIDIYKDVVERGMYEI